MTGGPLAPDRWLRIEQLFHASLELPPADRDTLLREACGPDEQLRSEIEFLLDADFQDSPLIAGIIDEITADLFVDDSEAREAVPREDA